MKGKHIFEPGIGKFVSQLSEGVTFSYDLCLGFLKECMKGLIEEENIK